MIDRESAYEKLSSGGFATVGTRSRGSNRRRNSNNSRRAAA